VLFRIYSDSARQDIASDIEQRILATGDAIFARFTPDSRDHWGPWLCLLLREILILSDERVSTHVMLVCVVVLFSLT
jgi:hypothetical protein